MAGPPSFSGQREKAFPMDAVTNCLKLSGLNITNLLRYHSGHQKSKMSRIGLKKKGIGRATSRDPGGESHSCLFQLLAFLGLGHITLVSASVIMIASSSHMSNLPCDCNEGPHPDIPGESHLTVLDLGLPDGPVVGTSLSSTEGCRFNPR